LGTIASCLSIARLKVDIYAAIKRDVGALAVLEGALFMMEDLAPIVVTGIAGLEYYHVDNELLNYAAATAAATARALALLAD
jgi:hypothetical protein